MNWLVTAAVALAVVAWGSRKVGARGEWPHDPKFDDDPPTLLDGWHGQGAP